MTEGENKPKHKHSATNRQMLVSYSKMGFLGWFSHHEKNLRKADTRVVIETERGLEIGYVVGSFCCRAGQFRKTGEQLTDYFKVPPTEYPFAQGGKFVRYATAEDISEERHINKGAEEELNAVSNSSKK